jgi:uncharacterized protein YidB (DUF937 family)
MGLFDQLLQSVPSLAGQLARNPQIVSAAASLLSSKEGSVGGTGGLAGLVGAFEQNGLGDMVNAWISRGPNPPVSASQLQSALGSDVIGQYAAKAGLSQADAGSTLAALLPALIDHVTPNGQVPQSGALEGVLGSLLGSLGK